MHTDLSDLFIGFCSTNLALTSVSHDPVLFLFGFLYRTLHVFCDTFLDASLIDKSSLCIGTDLSDLFIGFCSANLALTSVSHELVLFLFCFLHSPVYEL